MARTAYPLAPTKVLHAYSPLHNVRPGVSYPATLVTTTPSDASGRDVARGLHAGLP